MFPNQHELYRAIDKLRDAKRHIDHHKSDKAKKDISDAICYINEYLENQYFPIINNTIVCCCNHKPVPPPISPSFQKFFSKASSGTVVGTDLIVPANTFVNDEGTAIMTFPQTFQYFSLYINGMIQENGVASITPSQIRIKGGATLDGDNPIAVELVL